MSGTKRQRSLGQLTDKWIYSDEVSDTHVDTTTGGYTVFDRSKVTLRQNETGEFAIRVKDILDAFGAHVAAAGGNVRLLGGIAVETEGKMSFWKIDELPLIIQGAQPTETEIILGFGYPTMAFDQYAISIDGSGGTVVLDFAVRVHGDCGCGKNFNRPFGVVKP